jgi:hypothetical protein
MFDYPKGQVAPFRHHLSVGENSCASLFHLELRAVSVAAPFDIKGIENAQFPFATHAIEGWQEFQL